jgi:hypothetical protein
VAEEVSREGEVMSLNPADRVAANFARKMPRLALASGALPRLIFFRFFSYFFISRFAERRALGKGFLVAQ